MGGGSLVEFLQINSLNQGWSFVVKFPNFQIILDSGSIWYRGKPCSVNWKQELSELVIPTVNMIYLSHAHFDHIGSVLMIIKHGFQGKIIMNKLTYDLILLKQIHNKLIGFSSKLFSLFLSQILVLDEFEEYQIDEKHVLKLFPNFHTTDSNILVIKNINTNRGFIFTSDISDDTVPIFNFVKDYLDGESNILLTDGALVYSEHESLNFDDENMRTIVSLINRISNETELKLDIKVSANGLLEYLLKKLNSTLSCKINVHHSFRRFIECSFGSTNPFENVTIQYFRKRTPLDGSLNSVSLIKDISSDVSEYKETIFIATSYGDKKKGENVTLIDSESVELTSLRQKIIYLPFTRHLSRDSLKEILSLGFISECYLYTSSTFHNMVQVHRSLNSYKNLLIEKMEQGINKVIVL